MKNIKNYSENPFEFYKSVIKQKKYSKNNPYFKSRILNYDSLIESKFLEYDEKFKVNKLEDLNCSKFESQKIVDFEYLYSYKNKIFQNLKVKLTTNEDGKVNNTCQNCTIGEVGSFDHILPQSEFPEFIVHPKNLFPSCTICNSKKNKNWRINNKKIYTNLYLDVLPTEQYLFVDINIIANTISINYKLENIDNKINPDIFNMLKKHYESLDLFDRFKNNSDNVISELINSLNTFKYGMEIDNLKTICIESKNKQKKVYGNNYWKIILELTLLRNDIFFENLDKLT